MLAKEIDKRNNNGIELTTCGLTKKIIDNCFKYNHWTICFNSYDSEPDIDYDKWKELQSTEEGRIKYKKMCKEYEPKREEFCNWQDEYSESSWGLSKKQLKRIILNELHHIKKYTYPKYNGERRFWVGKSEDRCILYFYGRDIFQSHTWFCFYN